MSGWWRCSVTWMGAGVDREDAMNRIRALFDGLPLMGLTISASPMNEQQALRVLDREQAKGEIENDTDSGTTLTKLIDPPHMPRHPWLEGVNIFPPDHPLAAYERLARDQHDQPALDKMKELEP